MRADYLCGMTFAPFTRKNSYKDASAFESLKLMRERTGSNFVIFAPNGLQDTAQSERIQYTTDATVSDDELKAMIAYAQELGMKTALKPTPNCKNGTWRAHINFFDEDVICEPKWCNWFESFTEFQLHYAKISQEMGCDIHFAGCELVMSEHREAEWRKVIAEVRSVYDGLVSYNTDKYQEHNVSWWDCVDVISSSGYYPIDDWENQLNRIQAVVNKYNKPFLFAEAGCMSVAGSNLVPNDWGMQGAVDAEGQAQWYDTMIQACQKRDWITGMAFWSWSHQLYALKQAAKRKDYEIYGKPAEKVLKNFNQIIQNLQKLK